MVQSSHKMYSNNILNFQESTTILNACTKKSGNLLNAPRIYPTHLREMDATQSQYFKQRLKNNGERILQIFYINLYLN